MIQSTSSGGTVQLTADVKLTETVTINKNLTLDLNGHSIKANDCRALHVTAGDVTIKNTSTKAAQISSDKVADNSTFSMDKSVIRVGDGTDEKEFKADGRTDVKLTIEKGVKVTSSHCYGISVFGDQTSETLVVNGEVSYTGTTGRPAIAGNGTAKYKGTTITIGATGVVTAKNENAIYHPQAGTLEVYGTVGATNGGGIEAKAGTIKILDGAKVTGSQSVSHNANSNGCSTKGYAIAVVNNEHYGENMGANVTIDNTSGYVSGGVNIKDDDTSTSGVRGTIKVERGYFERVNPTNFAAGKYITKGFGACYTVLDSKDDVVAKIGKCEYGALGNAFRQWNNNEGQTLLTLIKDTETAAIKYVFSGYTLTLDLNGHNITYTGGNWPLWVVNGLSQQPLLQK